MIMPSFSERRTVCCCNEFIFRNWRSFVKVQQIVCFLFGEDEAVAVLSFFFEKTNHDRW